MFYWLYWFLEGTGKPDYALWIVTAPWNFLLSMSWAVWVQNLCIKHKQSPSPAPSKSPSVPVWWSSKLHALDFTVKLSSVITACWCSNLDVRTRSGKSRGASEHRARLQEGCSNRKCSLLEWPRQPTCLLFNWKLCSWPKGNLSWEFISNLHFQFKIPACSQWAHRLSFPLEANLHCHASVI